MRGQGEAAGPVEGGDHGRAPEGEGDLPHGADQLRGLVGRVGGDERLGELPVPAQDGGVDDLLSRLQCGDPAQGGHRLRGLPGRQLDQAERVQAAREEHLVAFLLGGLDATAGVSGGARETAARRLGHGGHVPGGAGREARLDGDFEGAAGVRGGGRAPAAPQFDLGEAAQHLEEVLRRAGPLDSGQQDEQLAAAGVGEPVVEQGVPHGQVLRGVAHAERHLGHGQGQGLGQDVLGVRVPEDAPDAGPYGQRHGLGGLVAARRSEGTGLGGGVA